MRRFPEQATLPARWSAAKPSSRATNIGLPFEGPRRKSLPRKARSTRAVDQTHLTQHHPTPTSSAVYTRKARTHWEDELERKQNAKRRFEVRRESPPSPAGRRRRRAARGAGRHEGRSQDPASGGRLSENAERRQGVRQLQFLHCAERVQDGRRRDRPERVVQDLCQEAGELIFESPGRFEV